MMLKDYPDVYHFFIEGVEKVIEWSSFNCLQMYIKLLKYHALYISK